MQTSELRRRLPLFLYLFFIPTLSACRPSLPDSAYTVIPLPTVQLEIGADPQPTPDTGTGESETETVTIHRPQYHIAVDLDYDRRTVAIAELLTFTNPSTQPLDQVTLVLEPARLAQEFTLLKLAWDSNDGLPVDIYLLEDGLLSVSFPQPLPPGESQSIFIAFAYILPERPDPFGYTERQAAFINWYALLPPFTQEQGWLVNPPGEVGEHLAYPLADYLVEVRNSDSQVKVAGPVTPTRSGASYTFQFPAARSFAWAASPEYEALTAQAGDIPITAYVFPEHEEAGETVLALASQSLESFQSLFGPYPYPSLTIVEIEYADGLEADGLFFLGEPYFPGHADAPQNWLAILVSHEIAHMWWSGLVGNDQAHEPWLDEALATYSEFLFYQQTYPDLESWWWSFRTEGREPVTELNMEVYGFEDFYPYVDSIYIQGASFLHEVRQAVGDQAFFAALQSYLLQNQGEVAAGSDFLAALEAQTDVSLEPIIQTYFKADE